jgi:hypothetical protein
MALAKSFALPAEAEAHTIIFKEYIPGIHSRNILPEAIAARLHR